MLNQTKQQLARKLICHKVLRSSNALSAHLKLEQKKKKRESIKRAREMVTVDDVYVLRVRKQESLYLGKTVSHETFKKPCKANGF